MCKNKEKDMGKIRNNVQEETNEGLLYSNATLLAK